MSLHLATYRIKVKKPTKKQKRFIVKYLILVVAIIEPLMTIPQIYEIWSTKQAESVSGMSWSLYIGASTVWLIYGLQEKDKPIIISSLLWLATEVLVVAGTLYYS